MGWASVPVASAASRALHAAPPMAPPPSAARFTADARARVPTPLFPLAAAPCPRSTSPASPRLSFNHPARCSACGDIFCHAHVSFVMILTERGKPCRVCNACFVAISAAEQARADDVPPSHGRVFFLPCRRSSRAAELAGSSSNGSSDSDDAADSSVAAAVGATVPLPPSVRALGALLGCAEFHGSLRSLLFVSTVWGRAEGDDAAAAAAAPKLQARAALPPDYSWFVRVRPASYAIPLPVGAPVAAARERRLPACRLPPNQPPAAPLSPRCPSPRVASAALRCRVSGSGGAARPRPAPRAPVAPAAALLRCRGRARSARRCHCSRSDARVRPL